MEHLDIDYHFVHDLVQSSAIRVVHVFAGDQLTDVLTKPLPQPKLLNMCDKFSVASRTPS